MSAIGLVLSILLSHSYAFSRQVLTYQPAVVSLVGVLDLQTFPGPPNYESIQNGDQPERHFYLRLDSPVDVAPRGEHPAVDNPEEERDVRILQLAIGADENSIRARLRKLGKGARVEITGTLFHRFTGHHHSRVLLSVNQVMSIQP